MLTNLRTKLPPTLRSAAFYGLFWGTIGIFGPFIYVYLQRQGITSQEIGILSMTLPICTLVVSPLVSRAADRRNMRVPMMAVLALLYAVGLYALNLSSSFIPVLIILMLANIVRGPIEPIANSIIVRMSSHYQFNFGRVRIAGSIVFTLTAIGLGALWQVVGFAWMFTAAAVLMLLVSVVTLLLDDTTPPQVPTGEKSGFTLIFKDWILLVILASSFMVGAAITMNSTFNGIYVDQIHAGELAMGMIMGVAAIGEIPSMEFGARIINRLGDFNALLLSYILMAVGIGMFGFFTNPWGLYLASFLRGVGYGLFFIASVIVIDRRAPSYLSSTYQSVSMSVAWGLAPLLSGLVCGWMYDSLGPKGYFLSTGAVVLLAAVILLPAYIFGRKKNEPRLPRED